jgi:hypothetical protein
MDKYDCLILLEKSYSLGYDYPLFKNLKPKLKKAIEDLTPNINSVFGVGSYPEFELDLAIFVSHVDDWKKGFCSNAYLDDTYEVLTEMGFAESSDGIWGFPYSDILQGKKLMTREEIIAKLSSVGFQYDEKFATFMMDV